MNVIDQNGNPLTAEEYVQGHTPWRDSATWNLSREHLVYNGPSVRYRIVVERNAEPGFGLDRSEKLGELGIYDAELDTQQFVVDFLDRFGGELSRRDARVLIEGLEKFLREF